MSFTPRFACDFNNVSPDGTVCALASPLQIDPGRRVLLDAGEDGTCEGIVEAQKVVYVRLDWSTFKSCTAPKAG